MRIPSHDWIPSEEEIPLPQESDLETEEGENLPDDEDEEKNLGLTMFCFLLPMLLHSPATAPKT